MGLRNIRWSSKEKLKKLGINALVVLVLALVLGNLGLEFFQGAKDVTKSSATGQVAGTQDASAAVSGDVDEYIVTLEAPRVQIFAWSIGSKKVTQTVKTFPERAMNINEKPFVVLEDLTGKKKEYDCKNVLIIKKDKPSMLSEPGFYLRVHDQDVGVSPDTLKPDYLNHKLKFQDGFGNDATILCAEEVVKVPLR